MSTTEAPPKEDENLQLQYKPDDFGGMRAECIDDAFLYKVCHVAGDLLVSASIIVRETGLKIQTTDPQAVAVVIIDLPSKMFSSYRCEGFVVAHVNMETLVNMLKKTGHDHSKFDLTLEIHADDPEMMYIEIFDKKKKTTTTHTLKLWEPKSEIIYFDEAQFDHYRVVSSRGLHEEINMLSHLVDPQKAIEVTASNDLCLSIEDEYGESATIFTQDTSPGYKVVKQHVDACAKDADGNYKFFDEIVGLQGFKDSSAGAKKGKKAVAPRKRKRSSVPATGRRHKTASESAGVVSGDEELEQNGNAETSDDLYRKANEAFEHKSTKIDDPDELAQLVDKKPEKIAPVHVTLSLLLLKMIAKGLRLDSEVFMLIKNNYPVMFIQRVQQHGRILIALAPKHLDSDEAFEEKGDTADNAMDQLMALDVN